MTKMPSDPETRFWMNVRSSRDGCWLWIGLVRGHMGYGVFKVASRAISVHRYSYALHFGQIPIELHVLHRCDNPRCVRPDHLYLGTELDNARDRDSRQRRVALRGSLHPRTELDEPTVKQILVAYEAAPVVGNRKQFGTSQRIANRFGVPRTTIDNIVQRRVWKHVCA